MLQSIRDNAQGIVSKILVGLIAFTFVIWGADSLFTYSGDSNAIVTVNGEEISVFDWLQESESQRRQLLNNNPDLDPATLDVNAIQASTLEHMIGKKITLQYAQNSGMGISDASIDQIIVTSDDFKVGGVFNQQRFTSLIGSIGLTVSSYKQQLRESNLVNQLQQGMAVSAFSLPEQTRQAAALDGQTRNFATITFPFANQLARTVVSDEAIAQYYQANIDNYRSPEQVKVDYVLLERDSFYDQVQVTDQQVNNAYQEGKAAFQSIEERNVAHILFNVDSNQNESQAMILAKQAYASLQEGNSFVSVAAEYSQDQGSAQNSGSLGPVQAGEFGGAFDEVMLGLAEGEYSQPVVTQFGVQIIKLESLTTSTYPSFEELSFDITETLVAQGAEELFVSASEVMADLAFSSPDLAELSAELKLDIKSSDWFDRSGGIEFGELGGRVANAAFNDEVLLQGNNSDVIELASDQILVLRKQDHRPPATQALSEMKETIGNQLAQIQAQNEMTSLVDALVERLEQGEDADAIAIEIGTPWQEFTHSTRVMERVSPLLSQAVFKLPRPINEQDIYGSTSDYNGDMVIIRLTAVDDARVEDYTDEHMSSLAFALSRIQGQADTIAFAANINAKAEIERQ